MNIVLAPNSFLPLLGGLELAVSRLALELSRLGHRVSVITSAPPGRCSTDESLPGVPVFRLRMRLPRIVYLLFPFVGVAALIRFRRLLKNLAPDIVNLHYIGENAALFYLVKMPETCKLVVSVHGYDLEAYPGRGWLARHLTRATLRRANRVLSNSRALLTRAIEIEPSVGRKSSVMANGVDLFDFDSAAPFSHPRRYALCVANFPFKKGQDVLVHAFQTVRSRHPDVDLLFAGDGRERSRCERLAADLGLDKGVLFLGAVARDEIPKLLAGCEMLVLPSRREAFGMVLLEAMAAGKPVVATRVDGIPELVSDGENGLLVNPDDPQALADAICALLEDQGLARRLGRRGKELARDYSWSKIAERYVAVYAKASAE